jgi:hypothetical protein
VADTGNQTIRKVTSAGVTSTFAGSAGNKGFSDGTGSAASFDSPSTVAVDTGSGNIFVTDTNNHTIRKITPEGVVTTFAGAAGGPGSNDGVGSNARFNYPRGVWVDAQGNVYVGDNATIRKITPSTVVTTLAGSPGQYGSVDGTGSAARFNFFLSGLATDSAGNIYIGDTFNNEIRKITPDGQVTTLAGLADSPGSADGSGTAVRFSGPFAIAKDSSGNLYVADSGNATVRKITTNGVVTTIAGMAGNTGSADGVGSTARFDYPAGVAVDSMGNIYVADSGPPSFSNFGNHTIRKITAGGVVTTFAGTAGHPGSADGVGSGASFNYPAGLAVDGADNIYVADRGNQTIRKITPAAVVTTLAGSSGNIGFADGTGNLAFFTAPGAVAVDSGGTVYVADSGNQTIRRISPAGAVTTLAGYPRSAGSTGGTGGAARFNFGYIQLCSGTQCGGIGPQPVTIFGGIGVDQTGNLYVGDTANNTIRKVTSAGVVTTVAGLAGVGGTSDGAGSGARFNQPHGLFVDGAGNIYVADIGNSTIRIGGPMAVAQSLNISTRARVQSGNSVLIAGFIVTGSVPKKVALRAIGPSLANSNVPGFLSDPTLELRDSSGAQLGINDNWKDASNAADVQAAGLAPSNELEAAFIVTLFPNQSYTAIVRGKGSDTGVALVEVFDLNPTDDSLPANLSTRGFVDTGDNVMIGGFILGGGNGADKVVVRALGPSLAQFGISNALSDPTLELRDSNGALVASNDNWKEADQAAVQATGLAPPNDLESAIVKTLPPGRYTAIVAGKSGSGVGLVEVYNLQ